MSESNSNGDNTINCTTDQAIKLFGRTIPVPEIQISANSDTASRIPPTTQLMESSGDISKTEVDSPCAESFREPGKLLGLGNCKEQQNSLQVNEARENTKPTEEKVDGNCSEQEKILKKPDKILPCPRCNSSDTKFCYFNNYNVNQPRYFCKNCQRYWTAGGTMRNVPIGAGRRKNKHLAPQYHQIMVSTDGVPPAGLETSHASSQQVFSCSESKTSFNPSNGNGRVIKFGPEAPLCESMENVLNLQDSKRYVEMRFVTSGENGPERSYGSSLTTTSDLQESSQEHNSMLHPMHCPIPPLVFSWNPASANSQYSQGIFVPNGGPNQAQWNQPPMLTVPGHSSMPFHFIPASYWGCIPSWAAGTGSVSLTESINCPSLSSTSNGGCSGNGSPTLGKHSRDANLMDEDKLDKSILVPKTIRLDNPNEASKIPKWSTLGIKPDQNESVLKGNIFRTLEHKTEGKDHLYSSPILEANNVALSCSHAFQQST